MTLSDVELEDELLTLPSQIKAKTLTIVGRAATIETQKKLMERVKNLRLEPILSARDGITLKPTYPNTESREIALEKALLEDKQYQELRASLDVNQLTQRDDQADLDYLHNLFSAYKTIAGMRGVR